MAIDEYLNLRFVNILHNLRTTPFTVAELYSATRTRQSDFLATTARIFRQDRVNNFTELNNYLIYLRDRNAWRIGVFKFFHEYYKKFPEHMADLSLRKDSSIMENFIDNMSFNEKLNDYYEECGHDPALATKYSVSKIICDEKRLLWMNTFCGKFKGLLDICADTGIVAVSLVAQINLVCAAFGLGIITEEEYESLLTTCGERIIKMFSSWEQFLAAILTAHLYEICLSSAEITYLPRKAQELIDNFYLCCNNNIPEKLVIERWKNSDLKVLQNALAELTNHNKLNYIWEHQSINSINRIKKLDKGFEFYQDKILPKITNMIIRKYFTEFSKYDEFIPICNGEDFKIYFDSLLINLQENEFPIFLIKFGMFTNLGFWSFSPYNDTSFTPWPDTLTIQDSLPINHDCSNLIIPFYFQDFDCDVNIQIPSKYKCDSSFLSKSPIKQAIYLDEDIKALKEFFNWLPKELKEYNNQRN